MARSMTTIQKIGRTALATVAVLPLLLMQLSHAADGERKHQGDTTANQGQWDKGSVSGNVYTNNSLGLRYEFPKDWGVAQAAMDYENTPPKESEPKPDAPVDGKIFHAGDNSCVLLEVAKHPSEGPRHPAPPSIRLEVGKITASQESMSARDVLDFMRRTTKSNFFGRVVREPTDYSFGGQTFSRMDMTRTMPTHGGSRTTYGSDVVGIRKGYRLIFEIVANNPKELDELFETLNSLQFTSP